MKENKVSKFFVSVPRKNAKTLEGENKRQPQAPPTFMYCYLSLSLEGVLFYWT